MIRIAAPEEECRPATFSGIKKCCESFHEWLNCISAENWASMRVQHDIPDIPHGREANKSQQIE